MYQGIKLTTIGQSVSHRLHGSQGMSLLSCFIVAGIVAGAATALLDPLVAGGVFLLAAAFVLSVARLDLCVLLLLFVRSSIDFSTEHSLVALAPAAKINLAAVLNLLLIASGSVYIVAKRVDVWKLPGARFFGGFLVVSLVSFARTPSIPTAVADWLRNLSCLIVYAIVATMFVGKRKVERVTWTIVLSAIVPLCVGFYQKPTGAGFSSFLMFQRIFGTFFHPNAYGLYLVLVIVLTYLLLHLKQRPIQRTGLLLLLLGCSLSLLWTYSRGAWIAAVVSVGLIALLTRWRSAFAALGIIVILAVALPQISKRFQDVIGVLGQGSFQWRVTLWKKMISLVISHPVLGYGLGSFYFYSEGWAAHNDYLRLAFETGVFGLVLYLLSVCSIGVYALRLTRRNIEPFVRVLSVGFVAILGGYLVASAAENVVMMPVLQWYLWALAGVVVALGRERTRVAIQRQE